MKNVRKWLGRIIPALFIIGLGSTVLFIDTPVFFRSEFQINRYIELARSLNIRNMVSAIYLGPRLLDTIIEVLVVVATVFGMFFIRRDE